MNVSVTYLTDMASGPYLYRLKIHSEFFFQLASMLSYDQRLYVGTTI